MIWKYWHFSLSTDLTPSLRIPNSWQLRLIVIMGTSTFWKCWQHPPPVAAHSFTVTVTQSQFHQDWPPHCKSSSVSHLRLLLVSPKLAPPRPVPIVPTSGYLQFHHKSLPPNVHEYESQLKETSLMNTWRCTMELGITSLALVLFWFQWGTTTLAHVSFLKCLGQEEHQP